MSPLSYPEIFSPVIMLAKFLAILLYQPHGGRLLLSKLTAIRACVYLLAYFGTEFYFYSTLQKTFFSDLVKMKGMHYAYFTRRIGYVAAMILTFFNLVRNYRKYRDVTAKMFKNDPELGKNGYEEDILKSGRNIRRKLLICVVLYFLNFLCGIVIVAGLAVLDLQPIAIFVVLSYPCMVVDNLSMTFFGFTLCAQSRFSILNDMILKKIEKSKNLRKYPPRVGFSEDIERVVALHKNLVQTCREVNSLFSFHLLLWIAVSFVSVVCDLYISTYVIVFGLFFKNFWCYCMAFKNLVAYFLGLYYLAKRSTELNEEANRIKNLLVGINIDTDKEDERKTVIHSCLRLEQSSLEITACKLFKIDNVLLFSICGAACSYLFIMIQLDMDDSKKS